MSRTKYPFKKEWGQQFHSNFGVTVLKYNTTIVKQPFKPCVTFSRNVDDVKVIVHLVAIFYQTSLGYMLAILLYKFLKTFHLP